MSRAGGTVGGGGVPPRNVVLGSVLGVPLSALFLWLAARNLDVAAAFAAVRAADTVKTALAVLAMGTVYLLQGLRWRRIATHEARLPAAYFVRWVVAGVAVNNAIPGRPGDLLRAHWLSRHAVPRPRALATVVVDRISDVLALVAALVLSYSAVEHPAWLDRLDAAAVGLGAVLAGGLVAAKVHARRRAFQVRARSRLGRLVSGLVTGVAQTVNRRDVLVVAALSCLAWAAWGAGAWLVASALGIPLSPLEVAFVTAVVNLGVALPSSPGFVGTYQWLCVASLGLLSVSHLDAFAFSVLMQAVWYVPTTAAGVALAGWRAFVLWRDALGRPAAPPVTVRGSAP